MQKLQRTYQGANNRTAAYDICIPEGEPTGLIIFLHGFMGYKDWGCWNLVQRFFTDHNFIFLKYNISHGGTTVQDQKIFCDTEAFGSNSYSKELFDLEAILNLVKCDYPTTPIHLIGHSRGGGIALLKSTEHSISSVTTWAAINSIARRFPHGEELDTWRSTGVRFQYNGRTEQNLPMYYSLFEDYQDNADILNIEEACKRSKIPIQIIHGENDTSVSINEGEQLASWTKTSLVRVANTAHTFDSVEPWDKNEMPKALHQVCLITLQFINSL